MNRFQLSFILIIFAFISARAQKFDVDTLQYTGDITQRINLVLLGDGYQESELAQFVVDANNFADYLFSVTPYSEYQSFFNVFVIKVPSNESGASHPGTATDVDEPAHPVGEVDNYFGSSFDYFETHRALWAHNTVAITNVLANNFPSYDQVLILVNTPYYGGTGGQFPTASLDPLSNEVAVHEIGHSFVNLMDEYWPGDLLAGEYINMTQETDPSQVKWSNWMDDNGIGIYQHCCEETSASWYKPHQECKMQFLGEPFCSVCIEGTIERIHTLTNPIVNYSPLETNTISQSCAIEFEIEVNNPEPNTLKTQWFLNDVEIASNTHALQLEKTDLGSGSNTVVVLVEDTTELLRIFDHQDYHTYYVAWNFENATKGVSITDSICWGDSTLLQGAYQTEEGIYYDTLVSLGGCDSVIATTLVVEGFDVSVSQMADSLQSNTIGESYQWINCASNLPLDGATNRSFVATENGNYAVEVTQNGCKAISDCYSVLTIGLPENDFTSSFIVYPNPTRGELFMSLEGAENQSDFLIKVSSSDGRLVHTEKLTTSELTIDMSAFGPDGLYYMQLLGPDGNILSVKKIVLNQKK